VIDGAVEIGRTRPSGRRLRDVFERIPAPVVSLGGGAIAWELVGRIAAVPFFPPLSAVVARVVSLTSEGLILPSLVNSLQNLIVGFVAAILIGILTGVLMGAYHKVDMALDIYIYALLTAPSLVFAPIYFMVFGLSRLPVILVIFMSSVFVVIVNTKAAVRGVSPALIEMSRSFCANDRQLFRTVVLPAALPLTMAGVRLATGRAVKGMLNGEMLIAVVGLGALVVNAGYRLDAETVLAVLLVIIAVAMAATKVVQLIDLRLTGWLPTTAKVRGRR
jgi:ABC-type nitrate/sulfonate/bicarbonate transport system permease component